MTNSEKWFTEIEKLNKTTTITTANGQEVKAEGKGTVVLIVSDNNNKEFHMKLENVLYVPQLETNLVSVKSITTKGHMVHFTDDGGSFNLKAKLYHLKVQPLDEKEASNIATTGYDIQTWHERLGHAAKQLIPKLKHAVEGLELTTVKSDTIQK